MPIHLHSDKTGMYYQYGTTGHKYYYSPSIKNSQENAYQMALMQTRAIKSSEARRAGLSGSGIKIIPGKHIDEDRIPKKIQIKLDKLDRIKDSGRLTPYQRGLIEDEQDAIVAGTIRGSGCDQYVGVIMPQKVLNTMKKEDMIKSSSRKHWNKLSAHEKDQKYAEYLD